MVSQKEKEFRESYSNYYPLVFNVVYSKMSNREDTEDVCHELFIQFYNKFEEIENHRKWLMSAISFVISNYIRKKATKSSNAMEIEDIENDPNLTFVNGARDVRIILNEAINNDDNYSNEKERVLFELIAVNNFTYEKAAKQAGVTKRQARYTYEKVTKKILNYLKDKGISNIEDVL